MNLPALQRRFGRRLRDLRTEKQWTQENLCERTGIGREHISRIENGHKEVCIGLIGELARCFGISISELMDGV